MSSSAKRVDVHSQVVPIPPLDHASVLRLERDPVRRLWGIRRMTYSTTAGGELFRVRNCGRRGHALPTSKPRL